MREKGKSPAVWLAIFLAPTLFAGLVGLGLFAALRLEFLALAPPQSLGEAIARGSHESVLRMLTAGASLDRTIPFSHKRMNGGREFLATPLTVAAARGSMTYVGLILEAGADLRSLGNEQALCAAVALGHGNVQDFLIARGADPNPRPKCDGDRRSPLRLARDLGLHDPASRLEAAGAILDY